MQLTPQQKAQRGLEASGILESAVFQESMSAMKLQIIEQWKACPVRDKEGQVLLLQLAKLADKFEGMLAGLIESGKFARHQIDLESLRDESPVRKFFRR